LGRKTENPYFRETDELWSTYFDTFGKPSGRATRRQKFVGQSSIVVAYSDRCQKCKKNRVKFRGSDFPDPWRARISKSKPTFQLWEPITDNLVHESD